MSKIFLTFVICTFCVAVNFAQEVDENTKGEILKQLENLRTAHLKSDAKLADNIYDEKLILTSQSGKKYTKKDALANIKNKFGFYENSDIEFLKLNGRVVITNFVNERQIANFNQAKYRVTAVWIKRKETWKIVSLQSSKVIIRKK